MDKAQKYTDKAIAQIEKLRNSYDSKPLLLSSFQVLLMEHIVQCRLVTGNKGGAIQEIGESKGPDQGALRSTELCVFPLSKFIR